MLISLSFNFQSPKQGINGFRPQTYMGPVSLDLFANFFYRSPDLPKVSIIWELFMSDNASYKSKSFTDFVKKI